MDKKLIKIVQEPVNWKKAIRLGVELLEQDGACTLELADKIYESVTEHGPYFIIMPQVALAHAAPGSYIKKPQLSLIKFDNEVKFSEKPSHSISLLFTLSAIDGESHMGILMKFSEMFVNDPNLVNKIKDAKTVDEIYQLVMSL